MSGEQLESSPRPGEGNLRAWERARFSVQSGYFWAFAAAGVYTPFITLYYRDLGFSGLQVGMLSALPAISAAFGGPLWGSAADSHSRHAAISRLLFFSAGLISLAMTQVRSFPAVFAIIALLAIASAPISSMLDTYAIAVNDHTGTSYGHQRIWGSLGYIGTVLVVGRILGDDASRVIFVANALCLFAGLLSTWWLVPLGERKSRHFLSGFQQIRGNRPLIVLLVTSYLISLAAATIYSFLSIRLKDDLGASASFIGVFVAVGVLAELPVIFFSGRLLKRFGASNLVAIAIVAYGLRVALFGLITSAFWLLPFQILNGVSYGAFLTASVTLIHRLVGREHAATAQTVLAACSFGLGNITGSLAGGLLFDAAGAAWVFRIAAILMAGTLIVFLLVRRVIPLEPEQPGVENLSLEPASG